MILAGEAWEFEIPDGYHSENESASVTIKDPEYSSEVLSKIVNFEGQKLSIDEGVTTDNDSGEYQITIEL